MPRTILLTGASGFLGKATYLSLIACGYDVVALVRRPSGFAGEIIVDLSKDDFESKLPDLTPRDAIVHLAAYVDFSSEFSAYLFKVNTLATNELAKYASRCGAQLVFASTATVCGVRTPIINSGSLIKPDTYYALSKWLAEELIIASKCQWTILRFAGLYGANGPYHLGLNKAIDLSLKGKPPELRGPGNGKRNYLFVEDAASMIVYCLEKRVQGVHFCAGPEVYSIKQLLESICEVLLNGETVIYGSGSDTADQIVEPSSALPAGRSFKEVLKKIKKEYLDKDRLTS